MTKARTHAQLLRPDRAPTEKVGDGEARHISPQKALYLRVDGFHAHVGIGLGKNGQDGCPNRPELAPSVRPAGAS